MKILHVANFSWFNAKHKRADNMARYYAPDRKISNGLIRNGYNVWDFSYRDTARYLSPLGMGKKLGAQKMNQYLINQARYYKPDLLLLGHCELLTPTTLATLRDMLPNCKIAQWWVDWFTDNSIRHLNKKLPYLDAFYATTAPSYYQNLIAPSSSTSDEASTALYYLPNITDSSVETKQAYNAPTHQYDVLFIGTDAAERAHLLQQIKKIPNINCGFFGFDGQPKLTGSDFITAFGNSKMGLNLSRATDIPLYSSDRLAQLTGNGCLTLTPRIPQMTTLFNEEEVVYYDSNEQLIEIIKKYSKDNDKWREIAKAGWQRSHSSYNERRVTQFMVEAANKEKFSEKYEWI